MYWLLGQALVITVVAAAVPGGASWLTLAGFVTPYYDDNVFALRVVPVPWTDPTVHMSLQTLAQMLAVAMAAAALTVLARTNPWQHGVLPDSTPPGRDSAPRPTPATAPPAAPPGAPASPASPPAPASPASPPPPPPGPAGL